MKDAARKMLAQYRRRLDARFVAPDQAGVGLRYWRERILSGILLGGLILSPLALIPVVALVVQKDLWGLALIDSAAVIAWIYLALDRRMEYNARILGVLCVLYMISLGVLTNAGIISGGPAWLFAASVFACLFLGFRAGCAAVALNAVVLAGVGYMIAHGLIGGGRLQYFNSSALAVSALGNFLLLDAAIILAVSIMLNGMEEINRRQNEATHRLRAEIRERKEAEGALQESTRKYRRIFENIQDVYYEASLDGHILEISPSIERLSKYQREELIGRSLYEIYAETEQRDAFVRELLARRRVEDYEILLKDKDGARRVCALASSLVTDDQDRPLRIVGSLRDITERKRMEAENLRLQKSESLDRMAGAIAHLFNNSLTVILGNLDLAAEMLEAESPIDEHLSEAWDAARRASEISSLLLTYLGQDVNTVRPVHLAEACREHLPLLRALLPASIHLETDLPAAGPTVQANSGQLQQILISLFTNALEAMTGETGTIALAVRTVSTKAVPVTHIVPGDWRCDQAEMACLEVSDTGKGISPSHRKNLFDPFFTTKFTGRGMGLAVALGIVKGWGGMIATQSTEGNGTTFQIFLPLAEARLASEKTDIR